MILLRLFFLSPSFLRLISLTYLNTKAGTKIHVCAGQLNDGSFADDVIITSFTLYRPLTEKELLERRELARLRHVARGTAAMTTALASASTGADGEELPKDNTNKQDDNEKG